MISNLEARITSLRQDPRIAKPEYLRLVSGTQLWVQFKGRMKKHEMREAAQKHGYRVLGFGALPSKLPRGLAEMLWNGVTHIITKEESSLGGLTRLLGFEPRGIAKVALHLHGPNDVYITDTEEGYMILCEYLGLKYEPPPPKPVAPPPRPSAPATPARPAPTPPLPTPVPAKAPPPAPVSAQQTTSQAKVSENKP